MKRKVVREIEDHIPRHMEGLLGIMADYSWHSLDSLSEQLGQQHTSVAALVRKLRKYGFEIEKRQIDRKKHHVVHLYRMKFPQ